jgi:hypothetical protein
MMTGIKQTVPWDLLLTKVCVGESHSNDSKELDL